MKRTKIIAAIGAALVAGFALGNMGVLFANPAQAPSAPAYVTKAVATRAWSPASVVTSDAPSAPATASPAPSPKHDASRSGATRRYCQPRYQTSTATRTGSSAQHRGNCWNGSGSTGSGSGSSGGCGW